MLNTYHGAPVSSSITHCVALSLSYFRQQKIRDLTARPFLSPVLPETLMLILVSTTLHLRPFTPHVLNRSRKIIQIKMSESDFSTGAASALRPKLVQQGGEYRF